MARRKQNLHPAPAVPRWEKGRNRYRLHAKCSELQFLRVVASFVDRQPVDVAVSRSGLSRKTVRGMYLDFRDRLTKADFNRWHPLFQSLPTQALDDVAAYGFGAIAVMHECAANPTCRRNYLLGNRKQRECRNCPLDKWFAEPMAQETRELVDQVWAFYRYLGISEGRDRSLQTFARQLIHLEILNLAATHSRRYPDGQFIIKDDHYLSCGTLMSFLLYDIVAEPSR